ncbi:LysM peptidoglycan-binding domain-containing protein [Roseateles chitinivorans]|uniref:LysM peptidoglycan-binding domain-containing protein n=1 Tax=Roseateles chitinivorans TaxID=2917965 RepID=UPI003D6758E8
MFDLNADNRMFTEYGYDDAGNRTHESYGQIAANSEQVTSVIQASVVQFDELNRIARTWDGDAKSYDLRYEYDAVGNRRAATSTYWTVTGATGQQMSLWYTYDQMNRFTTTMGSLTMQGTSATDTNGRIVRGGTGVSIGYDALGQRTSATTTVNGVDRVETYTYSADGYLEDSLANGVLINRRRNDASGRTLQMKEWKDNGTFYQSTSSVYDADNRLQLDKVLDDKNVTRNRSYLYYQAGSTDIGTASAGGTGALAKTVFDTVTTTYEYQYWDAAKQTKITSTQQGISGSGVTTFTYNSNGHLREKFDLVANVRRRFMTTAQGVVILREEYRAGATVPLAHRFLYADGHLVGDVGNDGKAESQLTYVEQMAQRELTPEERRKRDRSPVPVNTADFDQNYQPVNSGYPGAASSSYTVRGGDTLSSIAQSVWGDSAMWYMIAEVNGLSGNEALREGQVLVIPNKVTNIHNNATTFRPYNPGDAIGRVDPTLPEPPPPPAAKKGCGGIGVILMVVVAVVVSVVTAGAAAATLGPILAGAVGAAAGSAASQLVGMATGNVEKFSWKAVGKAAVSGALSAGIAEGLSALADTSAAGQSVQEAAKWLKQTDNFGAAVARGALTSGVTQAMQGKWSWKEVGASAVGSGAGYLAGQALGDAFKGVTGGQTLKMATASAVGSWASSQVMGYNSSTTLARMSQSFASGLGQGVGQAISDRLNQQGEGPWSAKNYQNGADIESTNAERVDAGQRAAADQTNAGRSAMLSGLVYGELGGQARAVKTGQAGGHFYLPALIADAAGISSERMSQIISYSQFADQNAAMDAFNNGTRYLATGPDYAPAVVGLVSQRGLHALNGRTLEENLEFYQSLIAENKDDNAIVGIALHGLADSVFHSREVASGEYRTFTAPWGHGAHGSEPDYVSRKQVETVAGQLISAFETISDRSFTEEQRTSVMSAINSAMDRAAARTSMDIDAAERVQELFGPSNPGARVNPTERMELNFRDVVREASIALPGVRIEDLPSPFFRGPISEESTRAEGRVFFNLPPAEADELTKRGMEAAAFVTNEYLKRMGDSTIPSTVKPADFYDSKVWSLRRAFPWLNQIPSGASQKPSFKDGI